MEFKKVPNNIPKYLKNSSNIVAGIDIYKNECQLIAGIFITKEREIVVSWRSCAYLNTKDVQLLIDEAKEELYDIYDNEFANKKPIYGYIQVYTRLTFADNTATINCINCDFNKPITYEFFETITNIQKNYYKQQKKLVTDVTYVTKDEYEIFCNNVPNIFDDILLMSFHWNNNEESTMDILHTNTQT